MIRRLPRRVIPALALALALAPGCGGGRGTGDVPADVAGAGDADAVAEVADAPGTDLPGDDGTADVAQPPACDLSTAGLRVQIGPDKPLFLFNLYGDSTQIATVKALLPDDVRARFAFHYVPAEPYDFSDAWQQGVEAMATAADAAGMPLFVQVEHGNTRNAATPAYWHQMFDSHPMLAGLIFAELCWSGIWLSRLDDDYIARIVADLEVVAAHDGLLLWQDMAADTLPEVPHVFLKAGADPSLMAAFRQHGRNVIVQDKHNGTGKRFVTAAAPMGLWASCVIGNWGVHSENWMWWEAGYGHLFQPPSDVSKSSPSWQSVLTFPDALFGIDWMAGLAGGATVFGLEIPAMMVPPGGQSLAPAFRQVLLPLIRRMLATPLAPTRDEARARMRVAYQPLVAAPPELMEDALFTGLYGPGKKSLWEWLPSTGRYYYLPILPVLSTPAERAAFAEVVDSDRWGAEFTDVAAKQAFFDARFPPTGEGDAWFVTFPGRLFAFNPNENADVDTTFRAALDAPGLALSATLPAHTSLLALPAQGGLDVDLSNYRIDAEADVWSDPSINDDPTPYLQTKYAVHPTDGALRRTTIAVEGLAAAATVDWSGDPRSVVADTFAGGRHQVTVDHNGPVSVRFRWHAAR